MMKQRISLYETETTGKENGPFQLQQEDDGTWKVWGCYINYWEWPDIVKRTIRNIIGPGTPLYEDSYGEGPRQLGTEDNLI